MLKKMSFQRKIFIYYSLLFMSIFISLTIGFSIYISGILYNKTVSNMEQIIGRVSIQIESVIKEMDVLSTQVVFNHDIQAVFNAALEHEDTSRNYFDLNYENANRVRYLLVSINSPKVIARRICIFKNRNFVSVGNVGDDPSAVAVSLNNAGWLNDVNKLNGKGLILTPHPDEWLDKKNSSLVISFARTVNATYSNFSQIGIVEVQQPYSMIENICKQENNDNLRIMIYNDAGILIYPVNSNNNRDIDHYFNNMSLINQKNGTVIKRPSDNIAELVYAKKSSYTGWTIVLIQPYGEFLAPVNLMRNLIFASGFVLILLTLTVIFFINKNLTAPIRDLRKSVNKVSLENLSIDFNITEGNNEVVQLNEAFEKMLQRLKESMNQTMQAQVSETHAHYLALQSQMNPHFLYNTLMGISAVAHELGSNKIISMCAELSNMLRYVGSFDNSNVKLKDELKNAENYLVLVKWRYEDRLDYEITIDENMFNLKVPKLIIQPIIENSFSHGFKNIRPPWNIRISGGIIEDRWSIEITDNGSGFSLDEIEKIHRLIIQYDESINSGKIINNLDIGGMGIINIYVRLKILYGKYTLFNIQNNETGATVTLGGLVVHNQ
jgi:two-component system, sensor histidine kinase YesM